MKRRLVRHESVAGGRFDVFVNGVMVSIAGIRPGWGIDGIAIDRDGVQLFFAALNSGELFRVPTATLRTGPDAQIAAAVAVTRVDPQGNLELVVQVARLRWPDGFAWERDGTLLLTCSALHQFIHEIFIGERDIAANAPYQIFRFAP